MYHHQFFKYKKGRSRCLLRLLPLSLFLAPQSMGAGDLASLVSSVARLQLPLSPMLEDGMTHRLDKVCRPCANRLFGGP